MSESVRTWRPLNGIDANEARVGDSDAAHVDLDEALAGLFRHADHPSESTAGHEAAAEDDSFDRAAEEAPAQEPLIRGDFAAIEAALLGATRPGALASGQAELQEAPPWARLDLRSTRADANAPPSAFSALSLDGRDGDDMLQHPAALLSAATDAAFYPGAGAPSDNFMLFDDAAVSGSAALDEEDKRSRRPIYLMAALVLAGVAGMTATSFRHDGSSLIAPEASKPAILAPFAAETASTSPTTPGAADSAQQAPVQQASATPDGAAPAADAGPRVISFSEPAAPSEAAPAQTATTEVPPASAEAPTAQAVATLPPVPPAPSEMATASILAPPPPGKAQLLAAPSVKAAIDGARKVKTAAVRPDGTLVKPEPPATKVPPQEALRKELPAKAALVKDAAAKDAATKAAKTAHLKTPHPATTAADAVAAATSKTAVAAKPAPVTAAASHAKPATADAQAAAPAAAAQPTAAAQPPAQTNGALAFVDTAVSSITGATGKLLDWGRTASSAH